MGSLFQWKQGIVVLLLKYRDFLYDVIIEVLEEMGNFDSLFPQRQGMISMKPGFWSV